MSRFRVITSSIFIGIIFLLMGLYREIAASEILDIIKVKEDIYMAIGKKGEVVGANAAIIINEDDVTIVDTHISPKVARELRQQVRKITEKPIKEVINTHFHLDHTDGNQVFSPVANIIGHVNTRQILLERGREHISSVQKRFRERIANGERKLSSLKDEKEQQALKETITYWSKFLAEVEMILPTLNITPPNLTLEKKIVLHKGKREIQIAFYGRGHTAGDVVVFLPQEKVLYSGDLLVSSGLPYMADGYISEWVKTLTEIEQLGFETVIPGHGPVFKGKELLKTFRSYLLALVAEVEKQVKKGATLEQTLKEVQLPQFADKFLNFSQGLAENVTKSYEELSRKLSQ